MLTFLLSLKSRLKQNIENFVKKLRRVVFSEFVKTCDELVIGPGCYLYNICCEPCYSNLIGNSRDFCGGSLQASPCPFIQILSCFYPEC